MVKSFFYILVFLLATNYFANIPLLAEDIEGEENIQQAMPEEDIERARPNEGVNEASPDPAMPREEANEEKVTDPTNVPFRSIRRRRELNQRRFRPSTRRGFERGKVDISPDPASAKQDTPEENPPAIRTATGRDADKTNIVVAGPEYNKEQADKVPKDLKPTLVENFDFHDASLEDVVKAISKLTKKNFILGQQLRGKITIISPAAISIEDAWRAFLTALQINDYATVESGAYIKIIKRTEARYTNIKTYSGSYSPDNDNIITRFINLKYIDAGEIADTLKELTARAGGRIFAYERTNTLIITDAGSNIKRLMKIIKEMDVAGFEEKLDIIQVRYASASEMAEKIAVITDSDDRTATRSRSTRRRSFRRTASASGGSPADIKVKIIPDDRTNSLIVLATENNLRKLRRLLSKIDYATKTSATSNIHIHYLQNASAEDVVTTLTGITGKQSGSSMGSSRSYRSNRSSRSSSSSSILGSFSDSLFSSNIKITADKPTNSLVIVASPQDYDSLKEIISKLDIRRKQVYVESIIAEVEVSKAKQLGVSASSINEKTGIFSFGTGTLNSLNIKMNPAQIFAGGAIGALTKGAYETKDAKGADVKVGKLNVLLKALHSNSDANVLSTPQILTTDNEEAEIVVGEKIPFIDKTTLNAGGSQNSVTRQPVGIKLNIIPQVNETSEYVKLKIDQEASDVSSRTVADTPSGVGPTTLERKAKTTVIVRDQDIVSIGGLIRDKIVETVAKVPLLGDVPLIGWLFRSKETEVLKTNLFIFIKPTIIADDNDLQELYHRKAEERSEFVTKAYGEKDVHQEFIEKQDVLKLKKEEQ